MVALINQSPPVPKVRPTADYVLIDPIEERETLGGIALPDDSTADGMLKGRVVKVGPGKWENGDRKPLEVEIGDVVYLIADPNRSTPYFAVSFAGKDYFLVRDVYCYLLADKS